MSRYNIFQAILLSFYSGELYRDVARNWGAKSFLYLFMLIALTCLPLAFVVQHGLSVGYDIAAKKMLPQVPVLTIKDGKIATPENRPYLITDPDTQETIAIIDTTGQYKTLEQANTNILVTETEVITKSRRDQTRTDKLPESLTMTVDPAVVDKYVKTYLGFAWILIFIIMWLGSYIYRILQALLYSILGKIFASIKRIPLAYSQVVQIAMVAITPTLILITVLEIFNVTFALQNLCYFFLAMIYLFYGIVANKS